MNEVDFEADILGKKYTGTVLKESLDTHVRFRFRLIENESATEHNFDANIFVFLDETFKTEYSQSNLPYTVRHLLLSNVL